MGTAGHATSHPESSLPARPHAACRLISPDPSPPDQQVDAELAPLKAAKRDEALRRVDEDIGAESRGLERQLEDLRGQVQEQRRQLADLDQKVWRIDGSVCVCVCVCVCVRLGHSSSSLPQRCSLKPPKAYGC